MTVAGPDGHRISALQQDSEDFPPPPGSAPPPTWLPDEAAPGPQPLAVDQAPAPPESEYPQKHNHERAPQPVPKSRLLIDFGGWGLTGWQVVGLIAVGLALWSALNAYAYVRTIAEWNAFNQAPDCPNGTVADGCKAGISLSVTTTSSKNGCSVIAFPIKGSGRYEGDFPASVCSHLDTSRAVTGTIWKGQLVELPGWNGWSSDTAVGQHQLAVPDIQKAALLDAGFAVLVAIALVFKVAGWVGRHV